MNTFETIRVGKRGTVVIPVIIRQKYSIEEGTLLMVEPQEEGILLRPAAAFPVEIYTPERKAEFLLNTAVTPEDYAWAAEEVRKLGLDTERISRPETGE